MERMKLPAWPRTAAEWRPALQLAAEIAYVGAYSSGFVLLSALVHWAVTGRWS